MEVQIFGTRKNADTRKALRFFAERRIKAHFVDLNERAASVGELRRFVERFGVQSLVDRDGTRFAALGLQHASLSDDRWLTKLTDEPLLLRMPLARWGQKLTVGAAEDEWRQWVEQGKGT
jgi:arsenate reductase (glutaredoxin)